MGKNVDSMTYEELLAEQAALAKQRTEVRLRQNAVADAISIYVALKGLSDEQRKRITIGGSIAPIGGTN